MFKDILDKLLCEFSETTYYIYTYGDNETKYSLVSYLSQVNTYIEQLYCKMLSRELQETYDNVTLNMLLVSVIYLLLLSESDNSMKNKYKFKLDPELIISDHVLYQHI